VTRVTARILGALAVLTCACGQPGPYAEWKTFRHPDVGYTIRYLDPPWEVAEGEGTEIVLRVPNNAAAFGDIDSSMSPKYVLRITTPSGAPASLAATEQTAAVRRGETIVEPASPFVTRSGDAGMQLVTQQTDGEHLSRRWVWVSGDSRTVQLRVDSVPLATEREVTVMLESLDVDPEEP
jgi:hypothetical protein